MSETWAIKGQSGKAVDDAWYSLPDLRAQGLETEFQTLASDTMLWTIWVRKPADLDALIPELGQQLTLYRNAARYFTGTLTKRRIRFDERGTRVELGAEGPWWYLKQIFISSQIADQSGDLSERAAYVLATGSPKVHIETLVARAIALGAPIRIGSVASCFDIPRLSLRNMSFAEAFSEVMRWVADGHLYFDYEGDDDLSPALCMQRRTPAAVFTVTPSAGIVSNIDVSPRLDLQVEEVAVMYATRQTVDNKRLTTWENYTAGESTTGLPRRQPVLTSGPELDTFLPPSFTDSVEVKSSLLKVSGVVKSAVFEQYDERLKSAGAGPFIVGEFSVAVYPSGTYTMPSITPRIVDNDGNAIPSEYTYYLTKGEIKDWWVADGIKHVMAKISSTLFEGPATYALTDPEPDPPAWFETIGGQKYYYQTLVSGTLTNHVVYALTVTVNVPLVTKAWALETTLIRKEDYYFVNPPADLADNLLATQDWLPYQGTVSYVATTIPSGHAVGGVLNIAGLMPEMTGMKAMISGYKVHHATGETTLTLGAPGRLTYRDLVNRFRQNGADNVVMLRDSTSGDPGSNPEPDPDLEIPTYPTGSILEEDGTTQEFNEDGTYPTTEDT